MHILRLKERHFYKPGCLFAIISLRFKVSKQQVQGDFSISKAWVFQRKIPSTLS